MTGLEALEWAMRVAENEYKEMEATGLKHPEDSDSRGRCFARARTANRIRIKIRDKIREL